MDEQWEGLPGLREMAEKIKDPNVEIPAYYYAPIHAYKDGKYVWTRVRACVWTHVSMCDVLYLC